MNARVTRSSDLRAWPRDSRARSVLQEYFERLAAELDPRTVLDLYDAAECDFGGADLSGIAIEANFTRSVLDGVQLVGAQLLDGWFIESSARGANLNEANLRGAQIRGADFGGATFENAILIDSTMAESRFNGCNLHGASFSKAFIWGSDFRDADLSGVDFGNGTSPARCTNFKAARLAGARVAGAGGFVTGTIDIGRDSPEIIQGIDVELWFHSQDAPRVRVR